MNKTIWIILAFVGVFLLARQGFIQSIVTTCENNEPVSLIDFKNVSSPTLTGSLTLRQGADLVCCGSSGKSSSYKLACNASDSTMTDCTGSSIISEITSDLYSLEYPGVGKVYGAEASYCNDILNPSIDCRADPSIVCSYPSVDSTENINLGDKHLFRVNDDWWWCNENNNLLQRSDSLELASDYMDKVNVCFTTEGVDYIINSTACATAGGMLNTEGFCHCTNQTAILKEGESCSIYVTSQEVCTTVKASWQNSSCFCAGQLMEKGKICEVSTSSVVVTTTVPATSTVITPINTTVTPTPTTGVSTKTLILAVITIVGILLLKGDKK